MRDCSRKDSPRIDNSEVNARFWVLRRDIRGRDTRRELPLSKKTPSLQTCISFHEAGTPAAKKSMMMVQALTRESPGPCPRHANLKSPRGFQVWKVTRSVVVHKERLSDS